MTKGDPATTVGETATRPRWAASSSRTTRRTRSGARTAIPLHSAPSTRRPGTGHAARPLPAHPVLPQALQVLLLQGLHREELAGRQALPRCARSRGGAVCGEPLELPPARWSSSTSAVARPRSSAAAHLRRPGRCRQGVDSLGAAFEEVTFECEPGTLTEAKLEAIREIGVTRLSLGVENLNDRFWSENGGPTSPRRSTASRRGSASRGSTRSTST